MTRIALASLFVLVASCAPPDRAPLYRATFEDVCEGTPCGWTQVAGPEGAAIFVLESEAQVRERGVEPLARLAGYGTSSDAGDLLRPDADGAAAAMRLALANAGVSRDAIDYVNAHGTGTVLNDMTETVAIKSVFGQRARSMPVTSTKPVHGHALGAAGALELAVTISALREGCVPPTLNWLDADPACDLDVVPNAGRACEIGYALSNSFAFGGINACVLVGRA